MISVGIKMYKKLGLLGVIEKLFFKVQKSIFWFWYISRFSGTKKSVSFEGPIELLGGKGIVLGNNIVIGSGVHFSCSEGAKIVIGDNCCIGKNTVVTTEKSLYIGESTTIKEGVVISGKDLKIGKNVWMSRFCSVQGEEISLGSDSILSPFSYVTDTNHYIDRVSGRISMASGESSPLRISDNVWICNGSTVTKGGNIGKSSIIAAGAVVTKDIPDGVVAGGIPAEVIKNIVE